MKPERVHELMQENFGAVWSDEHDWTNVHDGQKTKVELLAAFIAKHIDTDEVLVQLDYKHAAKIFTTEAASYIASHVLKGDIQIANLAFTEFVFISSQGVAAGWMSSK